MADEDWRDQKYSERAHTADFQHVVPTKAMLGKWVG